MAFRDTDERGVTYTREQAPDIELLVPEKGSDGVNSKSEVETRGMNE